MTALTLGEYVFPGAMVAIGPPSSLPSRLKQLRNGDKSIALLLQSVDQDRQRLQGVGPVGGVTGLAVMSEDDHARPGHIDHPLCHPLRVPMMMLQGDRPQNHAVTQDSCGRKSVIIKQTLWRSEKVGAPTAHLLDLIFAPFDLGHVLALGKRRHYMVIPRMIPDRMAFSHLLPREFGMQLDLLADQKEGEFDSPFTGQLQYRRGVLGVGTVVERERDHFLRGLDAPYYRLRSRICSTAPLTRWGDL